MGICFGESVALGCYMRTSVPSPSPCMRTFLSTKTPYRDERGEIIGLVGVSFDITQRIRAEEDRARLLREAEEPTSSRTSSSRRPRTSCGRL